MDKAIDILMIEDSEEDALLAIHQLRHSGLAPSYKLVQSAQEFQNALKEKNWDIVISDFTMPTFNGIEALEILRQFNPDIPFIFVSGTLTEDQAVCAMENGANDYVLKGNLKRLSPAVERSIADAKIKKERKLYEKQFVQAQKMESLGQLTGGIAHDFNNLLMVIQGTLYLLRMDLTGHEEYTQQIDQALEASKRGADLIRRLMLFSRQQQLQPEPLKLNTLLPATSKLLRPLLGAAISVNMNISNDLWTTWLDEGQFESALVNLAVNARDAMRGKGALTIEASNLTLTETFIDQTATIEPGEYVKISVSDNGCGISDEHIEHIFDPFFTTKEEGKGTGLGLSMVFGFVKESKGYITATSEVGNGTTFALYFPRFEAAVSQEKIAPPIKLNQLHGNETILLTEDDESLLKLTTRYLEGLGYSVIQAKDGVSALESLDKNQKIQLLISDVIMPGGITGPELVEQATSKCPDLKVIFVSGCPRKDLFEHHMHSEKFPLLTKPFTKMELATILRKTLDTTS